MSLAEVVFAVALSIGYAAFFLIARRYIQATRRG